MAAALFTAAGARAQATPPALPFPLPEPAAHASAETGIQAYVGASFGRGRLDTTVLCERRSGCDDTGRGGKLYAGVRVAPNLAIEGMYAAYGRLTDGSENFELDLVGTSFGVSAVLLADLSPTFTGALRLGLASNRTRVHSTVSHVADSGVEHHIVPQWGVAVGYRLTRALTVEASADMTEFRYRYLDTDGTLYALGIKYEF